jgi:hypothetical protein
MLDAHRTTHQAWFWFKTEDAQITAGSRGKGDAKVTP